MSKYAFAVTATACLVAAGGAAVRPAVSAPFAQVAAAQETIFYADSLEIGDGASALYELTLDAATLQAKLNQIVRLDASLGQGAWEHVDTLAATPDGTRLFFVDTGPISTPNSRLGSYEPATGELRSIGILNFSDTGIPPAGENTTDLAAISANGVMYLAAVTKDALYRVDLETAFAARVGLIKVVPSGKIVDLAGGDLAFDNTGRLYIWVNFGVPGAPRGLYRSIDVDMPVTGDVFVEYLGGDNRLRNFTGLAFRDAGRGALVASVQPNMFPEIDRHNGELATIWGYDGILHGGDLATGELAFCTSPIGVWANQSWNGRTISINGQVVDETVGKQILSSADPRNFSMLFAQLVGAKLNCESCNGEIVEAESFLLQAGVFVESYDAPFSSQQQRAEATRLANRLARFNNSNNCEAGIGRFTGGGQIRLADGVTVSRGLTVHCDRRLSNNLQVNWSGGNRFHMTEHLVTVACSDNPLIDEFPPDAPIDTLVGVGVGRFNGAAGYTIEFTLEDAGEPGRKDQMEVVIYETAKPSNIVLHSPLQHLLRGNLQAHPDQPHR